MIEKLKKKYMANCIFATVLLWALAAVFVAITWDDLNVLFQKPLKIEDLKVGMELSGTVRNVVDFGAFIDIGLHDDGLVHISKMTDKFIKHPSEVVAVGDIVTCYVDDISLERNRVSLSLINPNLVKN